MDPSRSTVVALAERRLAWLEARQRVLSQNIANADTPGYRPRDLRDFQAALAGAGVMLRRTSDRHLEPARGAGGARPDRSVAETTPDGNAVSLDQQALKVADTESAHAFAMGVHRRYLALFRTALGRNQ